MKTKLCLLAAILLFTLAAFSQTSFQKTYGDPTLYSEGYSVQQTFDGGYILSGYTFDATYAIFVVRTDAAGDTLWTRVYNVDAMVGFDIRQTSDSCFILTGYQNSSNPSCILKKIAPNGSTLWTRLFNTGGDWGQQVRQIYDGGYIMAGAKFYRTTSNGTLRWAMQMTGQLMSCEQTNDTGFIFLSFSNNSIYLAKRDSGGLGGWMKTFPGTLHNPSNNLVKQTSDGGYIFTGQDTGTYAGVLLVKTDANGDTIWRRNLGGSFGAGVEQTPDGGYAVTGEIFMGAGQNEQLLLLKTDASGQVQWTKVYGGNDYETSRSFQRTADGGYVLCGTTSTWAPYAKVILIKTDSAGEVLGTNELAAAPSATLRIFPNPAVSDATVRFNTPVQNAQLSLYNIHGQLVRTIEKVSGSEATISCEGLVPGFYFIEAWEGEKFVSSAQLVVGE